MASRGSLDPASGAKGLKTEVKSIDSSTYPPLFLWLEQELATRLKPIAALEPTTLPSSTEAKSQRSLEEKLIVVWKKIELLDFIAALMELPYRDYREAFDNISVKTSDALKPKSITDFINDTLIPLQHVLASECGMYLDNPTLNSLPHSLPLKGGISEDLIRIVDVSAVCSPHYKLNVFDESISLFEFAAQEVFKAVKNKHKAKDQEYKSLTSDLNRIKEFEETKLGDALVPLAATDQSPAAIKNVNLLAEELIGKIRVLADFANYQVSLLNRLLTSKTSIVVTANLAEFSAKMKIEKRDPVTTVYSIRTQSLQLVKTAKENLSLIVGNLSLTDGDLPIVRARNQAKLLKVFLTDFHENLEKQIYQPLKVVDHDVLDTASLCSIQKILLEIHDHGNPFRVYLVTIEDQIKRQIAELKLQLEIADRERRKLEALVKTKPADKKEVKSASAATAKASPSFPEFTSWHTAFNTKVVPNRIKRYAAICLEEKNSDPEILQDVISSCFSFVAYQISSDVANKLDLASALVLSLSETSSSCYAMASSSKILNILVDYSSDKDTPRFKLAESMCNYIIHSVDSAALHNSAFSSAELQSTAYCFQFAVDSCFPTPVYVAESSPKAFVACESKTLSERTDYLSLAKRALIWNQAFHTPAPADLTHLVNSAIKLVEEGKTIVDSKKITAATAFTPRFFSETRNAEEFYKLDAIIRKLGQLLNQIAVFNNKGEFNSLVEIAQPVKRYRNNFRHSNYLDIPALKKCLEIIADGSLLASLDKAKLHCPAIISALTTRHTT